MKEYLKPHYSAVRDKSLPALLFAEDGCKGERSPIQDMFNYQWKPGTDKPEEAYKDMSDCVRYICLEQPQYRQPQTEDPILKFLTERREAEYSPLVYGLTLPGS